MGSNMAECHPVAFRWPLKAKTDHGAVLMHIDPRFTRTSALCDVHAQIRAGTDIAFLGGLITYVINNKRWNSNPFFKEYVVNYTNAATLVSPDFKDSEDLDGVFPGLSADKKEYDEESWSYQRHPDPKSSVREAKTTDLLLQQIPGRPKTDSTLKDPLTVFQVVKRHYGRYTPEMVARICGCPREVFLKVAQTLLDNSGRDKTSNITCAVGWTQHTVGLQIIRTAGMLQALLGNIGRPGGGVLALRGHSTIQGAKDIAMLYHSLPGYLNMPDARKSPDLLAAAQGYEAILPLLRDADLNAAPVSLTREEARRKLKGGLPLLHGLDLGLDAEGARALMLLLAGSLENSEKNGNARLVRLALEEGRLDVCNLLSRTTAHENDAVRSAAEGLGLDPDFLRTLAENVLKPAFRAWRRQLMPLTQDSVWNRGDCPVCGASPVLGELRDNNLMKHLRCGRCGADWQFRRLQCLYCGNEDHRTLGFLYAEGEREKYRVEICEKCKGYLKVITTFAPTPPELLAVEDLATLHLD
ncbi:MAG: formate dehydrogenase accessory protein FdhE, partial [Nitrospirae bacterium]|nr:formate dehydrogenase accessory protein FdhE [Nitrospirota bacterium]